MFRRGRSTAKTHRFRRFSETSSPLGNLKNIISYYAQVENSNHTVGGRRWGIGAKILLASENLLNNDRSASKDDIWIRIGGTFKLTLKYRYEITLVVFIQNDELFFKKKKKRPPYKCILKRTCIRRNNKTYFEPVRPQLRRCVAYRGLRVSGESTRDIP